MKLFIITVSDIYDYNEGHHKPVVKLTKKEARKEIARLKRSAKETYRDEYNKCDSDRDSFSLYPDGYWGSSHFDACIEEVEVEGISKTKH